MANSASWGARYLDPWSGINSTNQTGNVTAQPSNDAFGGTLTIVGICVLVLVVVLGIADNSLALWLILRPRKVLSTAHVLLLDLIIIDYMDIVSAIISLIYLVPGWQFHFLQYVSYLLSLINLYGCPPFMTFIAIDQYFAVARPVLFHAWRRPRHYVALSVVIWLSVLVLIIPAFLVLVNTYSDGFTCQTMHAVSRAWKFYLLFSKFILCVIPVLILLVCYALTAKRLTDVGTGKESMQLMRRQVLRTIGAILLFLLICFAPYHVSEIYAGVMDLLDPAYSGLRFYRCYLQSFLWFLTSFTAFLNPLLYIFRSRNFQWRNPCCRA